MTKTYKDTRREIATLYNTACHGGGADARNQARKDIRQIADGAGKLEGEIIREYGFCLASYFASRPISS